MVGRYCADGNTGNGDAAEDGARETARVPPRPLESPRFRSGSKIGFDDEIEGSQGRLELALVLSSAFRWGKAILKGL